MSQAARPFLVPPRDLPSPDRPITPWLRASVIPLSELVAVTRSPDIVPRFQLSPPGPPNPRKPRRDRKPPVSFSDAELVAVLNLALEKRFRDYVMILVTFYHGFRANEIASLKVGDIDLAAGTIRIHRGKGSRGGTHDLQSWPDNPLLDERAAVGKWLAERHLYGKKGGAKKTQSRPEKMGQSTEIVAFLKNPQPGRNTGFKEKPAPEALYQAAVEILTAAGKASTSLLQRGLLIGYGPACQLIDRMELEGIVGPAPTGAGPRQMLTPRQQNAGKATSGCSEAPAGFQALAEGSLPPLAPSERLFSIERKHFWRVVNGYCRAAGIPRRKCKAHALKHTLVKLLVRLGHALNEIQEYVGFVSIETLNWYSRADEEELSERIGKTLRSSPGLRQLRQGSLF